LKTSTFSHLRLGAPKRQVRDVKVYLYPTNGAWVVMVWDGEHDVARWPDTQEGGALSGALLAAAEMAEKFCAANKQRWADFASAVIAGDDGTEMYWQTVKKNLAKLSWAFDPNDIS
jgi:hypothetical protein